jgi:two-component system sensor histidine kinase UhpB
MKLRTRLNLVVAGVTAAFVLVLISAEIQATRASIREEIEAANRVAAQLLGRLAYIYSSVGGPQMVLPFLQQVGHIRANDLVLRDVRGNVLYRSPPTTYKSGREAPPWFTRLMSPAAAKYTFSLPGDMELSVEANASRSVLDAWDDLSRLFALAALSCSSSSMSSRSGSWNARSHRFPSSPTGLDRIQKGDSGLSPAAPKRASRRRRSVRPSTAWRKP